MPVGYIYKETVGDLSSALASEFTDDAIAYVREKLRGGFFYYTTEYSSDPMNHDIDNGIIFSSTKPGCWVRDLRRSSTVNPIWYGAKGTGLSMDDDTGAFNSAIQFAIKYGYTVVTDSSTFYLTGTIAPGGKFTWIANNTTLLFDKNATYTQFIDSTTGKYVAFDTKNCGDSCINGKVILKTTGYPPDMSAYSRKTIPTNLIAWTASGDNTGPAINGQISWQHLVILGFGYGLYQGYPTTTVKIYPYTRSSIGQLEIQRCIVPFEAGRSATVNFISSGFDDLSINVLRSTRCAGTRILVGSTSVLIEGIAYIQGTDFHANSVFFDGLSHTADYEGIALSPAPAPTLKYVKSSSIVTITGTTDYTIVVGDVLAFPNPDPNNSADKHYYVGKVDTITGAAIHLEFPADYDVSTGVNYFVNPPGLELYNGKFTSQHYYVEEIQDRGVELNDRAAFVCSDFKVSGGTYACRTGYPIISTFLKSSVDINLHPTTLNNASIKGVVGFGRLQNAASNPTVFSTIACKITTQNNLSDWGISNLFAGIQLPGSLIPSSYYFTPATDFIPYLNAYVDCSDGRYTFSGANGSSAFRQESAGRISITNSKSRVITLTAGSPVTIYNGGSTGDFAANSTTLVYVKNILPTGSVNSYGIALVVSNDSFVLSLTTIVVASVGCIFTLSSNNVQYQCPSGLMALSHQINQLRIS